MASFKEQRLSEIDSLIKQVETYQKIPPQNNPFIQNRLAYLDENPCTTGLYYVNAYLKPGSATSQPNVLQRYIQTIQVQIPLISIISAATNDNFKISANITYPNSGIQIINTSQLSYCSTIILKSLPRIFKDDGNYEDMDDNEKIYKYSGQKWDNEKITITTKDGIATIDTEKINLDGFYIDFINYGGFKDAINEQVINKIPPSTGISGYTVSSVTLSDIYSQYWQDTNEVVNGFSTLAHDIWTLCVNAKWSPPKLFNFGKFLQRAVGKANSRESKIKAEKLQFWLNEIVYKLQSYDYFTYLNKWKQVVKNNKTDDAQFGKYITTFVSYKNEDCKRTSTKYFSEELWKILLNDPTGALKSYYNKSAGFIKGDRKDFWIQEYKTYYNDGNPEKPATDYFLNDIWPKNKNNWIASFQSSLQSLIFQVKYGPSAIVPSALLSSDIWTFDNIGGPFKLRSQASTNSKTVKFNKQNIAQDFKYSILSGFTKTVSNYNINTNTIDINFNGYKSTYNKLSTLPLSKYETINSTKTDIYNVSDPKTIISATISGATQLEKYINSFNSLKIKASIPNNLSTFITLIQKQPDKLKASDKRNISTILTQTYNNINNSINFIQNEISQFNDSLNPEKIKLSGDTCADNSAGKNQQSVNDAAGIYFGGLSTLHNSLIELQKIKQISTNTSVITSQHPLYHSVWVDTIDYDNFGNLRWNLEKVKNAYSTLSQDVSQPKQQATKKVTKDGKLIQRKPYCSWFIPLDYFKLFGLKNILTPIFSAIRYEVPPISGYQTDENENRIITGYNKDTKLPQYKTLSANIAIQNGYAYIPMGIQIDTQYTGIPITPDCILIPGVGFQYGSLLGGFVKPKTKKDTENSLLYPYENTLPSGQYFWLQKDPLSKQDLKNLLNIFSGDSKPINITYSVYMKKQLTCGYPKVKPNECTPEQAQINGVCGLQQLFKQPFTFNKRPKTAAEIQKLIEQRNAYWKSMHKIMTKPNIPDETIQSKQFANTIASDMFIQQAQKMMPQFSILPKQCTNLFCRAQRRFTGGEDANIITRIGTSLGALGLLVTDAAIQATQAVATVGTAAIGMATSLVGGVVGAGTDIANKFKNAWQQKAMLYQFCPRKAEQTVNNAIGKALQGFFDMTEDFGINNFLSLDVGGLTNLLKDGISLTDATSLLTVIAMKSLGGIFQSELSQCVLKAAATASVVGNTVKDISKLKNVNLAGIQSAFNNNNTNFLTQLATGDPKGAANQILSVVSKNQGIAGVSVYNISNMFNTNLVDNILDQFKTNNKIQQMSKMIQREQYIANRIKFYIKQYQSLANKPLNLN